MHQKLFPELASSVWRYFNLDYLASLQYPEDQYKQNPLLDAYNCDHWIKTMHKLYFCDYSYDLYGGNRSHIWRNSYLTHGHNPNPHDPYSGLKTLHLGIDFNVPAGTEVHSPLGGGVVVDIFADKDIEIGWGGRVTVYYGELFSHRTCLVYGHLSHVGLPKVGDKVKAGDILGIVASYPENGNVFEHCHVQQINLGENEKPEDAMEGLDGYGYLSIDSSLRYPDPKNLLIAANYIREAP